MPERLTLLKLRMIVGFLGEREFNAWWPTAFFDKSSLTFLEPVFVSTAQQARYHGVLEAARITHDERLSVGTYHLFRLPEELEKDLLHLLRHHAEPLEACVVNPEIAMEELDGIADRATPVSVGEGPVRVGEVSLLLTSEQIRSLAALYLTAFREKRQVFPYFVGTW